MSGWARVRLPSADRNFHNPHKPGPPVTRATVSHGATQPDATPTHTPGAFSCHADASAVEKRKVAEGARLAAGAIVFLR